MAIDILEKSNEYLKEGKFEKAQIILRRALDENPNQARVLELCGDLAMKLGRNDEAIQRYEHASENYTRNNQYAEAIVCLEKMLKIDKTNEEVFSRLADLYRFFSLPNEAIKKMLEFCTWTMENKDEAPFISCLRKIVEMQSKNLNLRLAFAKLLLSINRVQEALDELKKLKNLASEIGNDTIINEIKKLSPQYDGGEELDPKSRVELGNLLYEIGSKDEAIIEFNKAVSDLIQGNRIDEAIGILNRIVEIDPNNMEAIMKIKELKGEIEPEKKGIEEIKVVSEVAQEVMPEIVEEITFEAIPEIPSEQEIPEAKPSESPVIKGDLDILQDLSKEVAGFTVFKETSPTEEAAPEISSTVPTEAVPPLEGQIADIEFLLKEAEAPPSANFELARQFDEFRSNIIWESEDIKKKTDLAKIAFNADLYETALGYIGDEKDKKEVWPTSLEIIGSSLVRLGRYGDAIRTIGPMILLEEIPEVQKVELRYVLASAYEGLGDFENALRETEHIIAINPNYRDVREIYQLLGGQKEFAEPERPAVITPPLAEVSPRPPVEEVVPSPPIVSGVTERQLEETYPIIVEEELPVGKVPTKKLPEEVPEVEEKEENITFL